MAHPSRRSRRRSTRSRRRLGVGLAFGLIATALAIGALVPAFAAATQNAAPQTASATTAPPDTTKPADNPPSETQPDQGSPQQPSKSSGAAVQAASTIVYTGQGTTGGACDTFLDPDESPVTFNPATQQVWQFNLTQTAAGATMSGSFSDGTTVTNKAEDTHTGKVSKWFIVTAKGATVVSASATYTPDGDNSQFVVSHCWGTTTPATGSLTVSKTVAGTPTGGATFTVAVDCNDGSGHDRTLTFDSTGALTGGGPLPITGIPAGTQCSVTETGTGSASSVSYSPGGANPPTVTIAANQQSSVTVTNTYTGSLTVTKTVAGAPPGGTTFTVAVDCNDGSGHDRTLTFDSTGALTGGGPLPITGIPAGTQCSVTETGTGSASSVTYSPGGANPPTVTIAANQQSSVAITNTFTGSLTVTKSVAGTPPGGATFTVAVDCNDGSGHDRTLTFDSTGALTGGGPLPITGIPAGAQCSVTETGTGSASSVTYSPGGANPPTVTIAANQQSSVTVTNTYNAPETGSLQVKKVTEGDVPPNTSWQATVTCTSPSFSTVLSFGPNDLGPKTVTGIPLSNGSNSCSVAETDQGTPPPTLVTVTPNSAQSVTTNQTPLFTVTNSYPSAASTGSVSVTKAVTGDGARPSDVQFTVHVSCTDGTEADLIFGSDGGTKQVNGIKIEGNGTNCTVTEPETGQASNVSFSPEDNGKFTLTVNTPTHAIKVTNRFDVVEVGGISVTGGAGSVGRVATGALPFTGSPTAMLLKIAALLIGVGGGALLLARNRRRRKLLG